MKVLLLRTVGNFLIFSSLFIIARTFYQPLKEEGLYVLNSFMKKEYVVAKQEEIDGLDRDFAAEENAPGGFAQLLNVKKTEVLVPEDSNFSVVIPKIGANARIQANVNAADEKIYLEALRRGVAHAEGTAFPGEGGHIFLFAHSTDYIWNLGSYNAVFYLLYKLENDDEVNIFYKGQRYTYKVTGREIVNPDQVDYLTRKTDREFITLQTCWPPGTTLKRLLIFAERVIE